jgi:hypothetical protein
MLAQTLVPSPLTVTNYYDCEYEIVNRMVNHIHIRDIVFNGAGSMFGDGIYLAEDVAKVDQYVKSADNSFGGELAELHKFLYGKIEGHPQGSGVHYIFLCRVGLGCMVRTRDGSSCLDPGATSNNRIFGKGKRELNDVAGATAESGGMPYHSLLVEIGGSIERFREVVVFKGRRIYPEYLLAYSRENVDST